mmetsp:Transcript_180359/g.438903  ORF Transcript_180359/g.438903 Transcript_180359/m.438903 type:complete len:139 (+) Transcript_180359:165-581(+)
MASATEAVVVPRNFYLLAELEDAEKHAAEGGFSYGLASPDDITLSDWSACIPSPRDDSMAFVHLTAGPSYPDAPPELWFTGEVSGRAAALAGPHETKNIGGVSTDVFRVRADQVPYLAAWRRGSKMAQLLAEIRRLMG